MAVGGLNEIRGENILAVDDERPTKGGGGKNITPKDVVRPTVETSAPSGELSVSIKSESSALSGFKSSITITNTSTSNYYLSESGKTTNEWIAYDFGKNVKVTKIALLASPSYDINPKDITIQIPKDKNANDWVDFCKFEMKNGKKTSGWQIFQGFTVNTNYLRLFMHNRHGTSGGDYFLLCGARFYSN